MARIIVAKKKPDIKKPDNQITRNVGLYFVCYKLSTLGWNVLPTNTKEIDLLVHKSKGDVSVTKRTIQTKTLSKQSPAPLGENLDNLFADWFIICQGISPNENPKCFILSKKEVLDLKHTGENDKGEISYWLQKEEYEKKEFEENWERMD